MRDKFFQLYNNDKYIKEILYKYFTKLNTLITANTNKGSYCSYCNNSLKLKTPKCKIYNKKRVSLNTKKKLYL